MASKPYVLYVKLNTPASDQAMALADAVPHLVQTVNIETLRDVRPWPAWLQGAPTLVDSHAEKAHRGSRAIALLRRLVGSGPKAATPARPRQPRGPAAPAPSGGAGAGGRGSWARLDDLGGAAAQGAQDQGADERPAERAGDDARYSAQGKMKSSDVERFRQRREQQRYGPPTALQL